MEKGLASKSCTCAELWPYSPAKCKDGFAACHASESEQASVSKGCASGSSAP